MGVCLTSNSTDWAQRQIQAAAAAAAAAVPARHQCNGRFHGRLVQLLPLCAQTVVTSHPTMAMVAAVWLHCANQVESSDTSCLERTAESTPHNAKKDAEMSWLQKSSLQDSQESGKQQADPSC